MIEVAEIFRQYGEAYRTAHKLALPHLKAMRAIECCPTSESGIQTSQKKETWSELLFRLTEVDHTKCPVCRQVNGFYSWQVIE